MDRSLAGSTAPGGVVLTTRRDVDWAAVSGAVPVRLGARRGGRGGDAGAADRSGRTGDRREAGGVAVPAAGAGAGRRVRGQSRDTSAGVPRATGAAGGDVSGRRTSGTRHGGRRSGTCPDRGRPSTGGGAIAAAVAYFAPDASPLVLFTWPTLNGDRRRRRRWIRSTGHGSGGAGVVQHDPPRQHHDQRPPPRPGRRPRRPTHPTSRTPPPRPRTCWRRALPRDPQTSGGLAAVAAARTPRPGRHDRPQARRDRRSGVGMAAQRTALSATPGTSLAPPPAPGPGRSRSTRPHGPTTPPSPPGWATSPWCCGTWRRPATPNRCTQRALAINEAAYGPDHPTVATALGNLAAGPAGPRRPGRRARAAARARAGHQRGRLRPRPPRPSPSG